MKQMILKVDKNCNLGAFGVSNVGRMVGTRSYYGKHLVLACCTKEQIEAATQPPSIDDGEIVEPVSIKIMAVEGEPIDQTPIRPFMLEEPLFDEDGEILEYIEATDLTGKLQTLAGRQWVY